MAKGSKTGESVQVRKLRTALAREKEKSAALAKERREAREQQAAATAILKVINRSPSDAQPVFEAIATGTLRLLRAHSSAVMRLADGVLHLAALTTTSKAGDAFLRRSYPAPLAKLQFTRRTVQSRAPCFIEDTEKSPVAFNQMKALGRARGFRSALAVPMLSGGEVIGTLSISRKEPGPFGKHEIRLLQSFAEQAVIAIENVRRFNETKEALERQTATAEILKVIASSPSDVQPVFDAIAGSAKRLCGATFGAVFRVQGDMMDFAAHEGFSKQALKLMSRRYPRSLRGLIGWAVLKRAIAHSPDVLNDSRTTSPELSQALGYRALLGVPMCRDRQPIGAIAVYRRDPGPFTDAQISLLQTFADQAVIAIENVRLFNETKEALERQTATAEILRVISSSPTNIQPVLDAVAERAARLCQAADALIRRVEDRRLVTAAHFGPEPVTMPVHGITRGSVSGRAIVDCRTVHVHDIMLAESAQEYPDSPYVQNKTGHRTILAVPLMREGTATGVIVIRRTEARPFTDKQIQLLETFADQAVIAIENVRLFNETKEALERQTATAEILKVIASSPSDTQPVFDAIVASGARLIGRRAVLRLEEGGQLRRRALSDPEVAKFQGSEVMPIDRDNLAGRTFLEGLPMQVIDTRTPDAPPFAQKHGHLWNFRSNAAAPLLRDGKAIGVISVNSPEPGALSDKQMELLQTFADQAVIAIENVRLFNETKEALERQTATAEILQVIASSPTDVQPVFDAIALSAVKLLGGFSAAVTRIADGSIHLASFTTIGGAGDEVLRKIFPQSVALSPGVHGRAARTGLPAVVTDALAKDVSSELRQVAEARGFRSMIAVPMIREGTVIGTISVPRREPGEFPGHHVDLLKTFAAQAVIAIENVRLFNETKQALERQTATAEILKVIASSPSDVQPVFDTIASSALRLIGGVSATVTRIDGDLLHLAAVTTADRTGDNLHRAFFPVPADRGFAGEAIRTAAPVCVEDIATDPRAHSSTREHFRKRGLRSAVVAPMSRSGTVIGLIHVHRAQPGTFSDHHIKMLQTFADQAVIAIENVRLFNETKEALERQTATAEILNVISRSPTDVTPVFECIVQSAVRLTDALGGALYVSDGQTVDIGWINPAAGSQAVPMYRQVYPLPIERNISAVKAIRESCVVHVPDMLESDFEDGAKERARIENIRSNLCVPMLRSGRAVGSISVVRREAGLFPEHQVKLLQTFADQAVIAIENVRLFNETREALERQTATAEILEVIASSPSDVQPVFEAIAAAAARLIGGFSAAVTRLVGDSLHLAALTATSPSGDETLRRSFPRRLSDPAFSLLEQAIHTGKPAMRADAETDPQITERSREMARARGYRSMLAVPMIREGTAIGTISVTRQEAGGFTDHQVGLLKTFADQAVIAIENVRLFNETKEALERQTATAEILKVISSSPTDTAPVFETILENATRLCDAHLGVFGLHDGQKYETVAHRGGSGEFAKWLLGRGPFVPSAGSGIHEMLTTHRPIHYPDYRETPAYVKRIPTTVNMVELGGVRTYLAVPMLKEGSVVGGITIYRREVRPFTQRQIDLVSTFADQAVIAIENVRLFNETKEALERQTATAEILNVISRSPTDAQPVFDAILDSALRLTKGATGGLFILEGTEVHVLSARGAGGDTKYRFRLDYPAPITYDAPAVIAIREARIQNVADSWDPKFEPAVVERARAGNYRSALCVPMLRDGKAIGSIAVVRREPGLFDEKHVALFRTFADQAVIAIENVRLFKELQSRTEALTRSVGQLTALGEVGQAISSTLDLEKVLKTIVNRAVQLTGLDSGSVYEYDEMTAEFQLRATENVDADYLKILSRTPIRKGEGAVGRTALTGEPTQIPDVRDRSYQSRLREAFIAAGYRAVLVVPMLREEHIIGALTVSRKSPGPFADEVVELMKTFATQSAMAIQNARLFREIAEKGKQLEIASQHKSQFLASMSHELRTPLNALLGFNEMILGDVYGPVPDDMQPPLAQMQTSGKHLLRLINNVLDLAKIEAGRMELALSDYSVQDTVEAVRSTLRPLAAEKGIEFLASVPTDIPLAYGDPGRITQCLMNLAGNSLKFTKVGKVEISVAENGQRLLYRVADTGVGIPPDKIDSLFTEFKQTDATIASEYGGTGLGLSISKKFVEMHGGRIWVESTPGQGSTFSFEIPLRAGEGKPA